MRKFRAYSILAVGILALMLGGCTSFGKMSAQQQTATAATYGLEASQVAQALLTAKPEIAASESAIKAEWGVFTPAQQAELQFTKVQIDTIVSDVDSLGHGSGATGTTILVNLSQLTKIYTTARAAYLSAKSIVIAHQSSFTPLQQLQFNQLDLTAKTLDGAVQQLLKAPGGTNITPMIVSALQIAALAAKVAVAAGA